MHYNINTHTYIYIYYIYLWHIPCTYYEQIWEDDWSEIIHITQADIYIYTHNAWTFLNGSSSRNLPSKNWMDAS